VKVRKSREALLGSRLAIHEIEIVVRNIRYAYDQHTHSTFRPVNDSRWNMHERAFLHGILDTIEQNGAFSVQDVVKLRGSLVEVRACSVDVNGMCPRRYVGIFPADQAIPPSARAPFSGSFSLVSDERLQG